MCDFISKSSTAFIFNLARFLTSRFSSIKREWISSIFFLFLSPCVGAYVIVFWVFYLFTFSTSVSFRYLGQKKKFEVII